MYTDSFYAHEAVLSVAHTLSHQLRQLCVYISNSPHINVIHICIGQLYIYNM